MLRLLTSALAAASTVLGCADHSIENIVRQPNGLSKRAAVSTEWAYEASFNWGRVNSNYTLCQAGTQQSPIGLMITQGLSLNHIPTFNFTPTINGYLYNWGYGPAYSIQYNGTAGITTGPSVTYDNKTLWLKGWHIHAPADHSVQGDRSKAELHFVMADANAKEAAVLAIRIDPGNQPSPFFAQFPPVPSFDNSTLIPMPMNAAHALVEVAMFNEFWTYRGSLTSPPCTEGIRFFIARNVLFVSVKQMIDILAVSTYSARVEQEVWQHQINA